MRKVTCWVGLQVEVEGTLVDLNSLDRLTASCGMEHVVDKVRLLPGLVMDRSM